MSKAPKAAPPPPTARKAKAFPYLLAENKACQDKVSQLRVNLEDLGRKRQALENDASIRDTLIRRSQMTRELKEALKCVFDAFKTEAATDLGIQATNIMKLLLDTEGMTNLKEIIVERDYSLQMCDQWNGQFLANISAGQRQIMSIAFITALARAASGGSVLEITLQPGICRSLCFKFVV
ncbi:MAG: hypothetical protein PHG96_11370 [Kiritimatiellae bacterium]|nr:hypothetical protein [Kiritimatiellia bacterium]MDD4026092.1 hypothetical protein [Kiritimatiellia bacterium]MDD4622313.1 hypothetical protein [Kiritimatiellia bacterium]